MVLLASISGGAVEFAWHLVRDGGYPAIFLLMLLGSACVPVPSEVVLLFAGFAIAEPGASNAHHDLTLAGVTTVALIGNVAGSWIAYGIGRAGRLELFERHARWFRIKPGTLERADAWFARYGAAAVFFGRWLPIVRAFISLPAGIARMPFWKFSAYTVAGWLPLILATLLAGEALGGEWESVHRYSDYVDYAVIAAVLIGAIWLAVRRRSPAAGDASA